MSKSSERPYKMPCFVVLLVQTQEKGKLLQKLGCCFIDVRKLINNWYEEHLTDWPT